MAKKRRQTAKRDLKHHIAHKSRLTLLLALKIFLILLSFFVVMALWSFFSPWTNFTELTFLNIFTWAIGLAIAILLYLFLVIKVLNLLKFKE